MDYDDLLDESSFLKSQLLFAFAFFFIQMIQIVGFGVKMSGAQIFFEVMWLTMASALIMVVTYYMAEELVPSVLILATSYAIAFVGFVIIVLVSMLFTEIEFYELFSESNYYYNYYLFMAEYLALFPISMYLITIVVSPIIFVKNSWEKVTSMINPFSGAKNPFKKESRDINKVNEAESAFSSQINSTEADEVLDMMRKNAKRGVPLNEKAHFVLDIIIDNKNEEWTEEFKTKLIKSLKKLKIKESSKKQSEAIELLDEIL